MGSYIEINDTLRITKNQGFPADLNLETHLENPYAVEAFTSKTFTFTAKPAIRNYQQPPVRNFLVEDLNGKWIYWGLIHILEITHDYVNKTTSGKYKIIYLNTPEEMQSVHHLIDQNPDTNYFTQNL